MSRMFLCRPAVWRVGLTLLGSIVLLAAGCAGSYHVVTNVRDDGTTTYTLAHNEISVEGASKYVGSVLTSSIIEKRCVLDVRASDDPGGKRTFELLLTYIGKDPMDMEPGRSLEIIADANSYVLSARGGTTRTRDPSGTSYTESLIYPVTRDVLLSMADAQSVQTLVKGPREDVRGYFDEKNLADFRRFVSDYVRPR
jgi:hypothetical protein